LCGDRFGWWAESWALAPLLQTAKTRAVRNAKAPILFFRAQNDWNLEPTKALSEPMKQAGKTVHSENLPSVRKIASGRTHVGYFGSAV